MNKYILTVGAPGYSPEIEITEDDYISYRQSRAILINCLAIEENYEILVSNYLDFEKQILAITATHMIRDHVGYSDFFNVQFVLNICLVNLLTSARSYIDQLKRLVEECVPHSDAMVKELLAKEYDESAQYRFMEELRNHVQHRGLPVHWTSSHVGWTDLGEDGLLEYSTEFASEKRFFVQDGKFKKRILNEIPEYIDLKEATRSYVGSLSTVHIGIRRLIQQAAQGSRSILQCAHDRYRETYGKKSLIGLNACVKENGETVETIPLLLDWDDIRVKLQERNQQLSNLKKRYVTGKVRKEKQSKRAKKEGGK